MNRIEVDTVKYGDCTLGRMTVRGQRGVHHCFTLELPWLNNRTNISCIPEGEYKYFARKSPSNGNVLQLEDVPDRTYIQVHSGNYTSQIAGCILVGDSIRFLDGDTIPDVANSRHALGDVLMCAGKEGIIEIRRR